MAALKISILTSILVRTTSVTGVKKYWVYPSNQTYLFIEYVDFPVINFFYWKCKISKIHIFFFLYFS